MASIDKEIAIEVSPDYVWTAIRDVGAVHKRLMPDILVDARIEEDIRILTFASGAEVRELIISIDDKTRRLAYAVVEGSQRTTFHHATMQVFADGDHNCRLVWITDFLPHSQAPSITRIIDRRLEIMKNTLESSSRASLLLK